MNTSSVFHRRALDVLAVAMLAATLAGCSAGGAPEPGDLGAPVRPSSLVQPVQAPGTTVYPNVAANVDPSKAPTRSDAEVRAMEANLMSLAATQDGQARAATPASAAEQLKALARRQRALADENLQQPPKN